MDMKIPHLDVKILIESNPLKSRILVRRLAVVSRQPWYKSIQVSIFFLLPASYRRHRDVTVVRYDRIWCGVIDLCSRTRYTLSGPVERGIFAVK